ncbi:hypothetical protein JG687_00018873 [Phytophthora cactorum]|uniref:Uncharacterized protein n=1 Tax=Phytophthora cactorum TaxID=29920 RepID=A0A8T1TLN2_9STRA|nr:hypothetical protein JG687_00018873 [Phytophthora cactorum]
MPFTAPGAKSCFERVLSRVLPDPTPGDVVIRVTIESLRAFFDYEDPNHPSRFQARSVRDTHQGTLGKLPRRRSQARSWVRALGAIPLDTRWCRQEGFAREASDPNHDRTLLKSKATLWRLLLSQRNNRADRLRNMYQDQ